MLGTCLLLAVVMLAMLSAECDQSVIQEPAESVTGKMLGSSTAEPCDEATPQTLVAHLPPEKTWISEC